MISLSSSGVHRGGQGSDGPKHPFQGGIQSLNEKITCILHDALYSDINVIKAVIQIKTTIHIKFEKGQGSTRCGRSKVVHML